MIDGIILGNGTSRTMQATLPQTYEEFRAACAAGTQLLDLLFHAPGWQQLPSFLNKANLLSDDAAFLSGAAPRAYNVDVSQINDGDLVLFPENGKMVWFVAVQKNYQQTLNPSGVTLFVRQDPLDDAMAMNITNTNAYANSTADTYLNTDYFDSLDQALQDGISETSFPYTVGNGNNAISTLSRKVFMPSIEEYGLSDVSTTGAATFNKEGSPFPTGFIAPSEKYGPYYRIYTRTPSTNYTNFFMFVSFYNTGVQLVNPAGANGANYSYRPCFALPNDFSQTFYYYSDGSVASQEIDGTLSSAFQALGKFNTYWWSRTNTTTGETDYVQSVYDNAYPYNGTEDGYTYRYLGCPFQEFLGPTAKIVRGRYFGTGTYGQSNPTKIALPFSPKLVIIQYQNTTSWAIFMPPVGFYYTFAASPVYSMLTPTTLYENVLQTYTFPADFEFYSTVSADYQMNRQNYTYHYTALG